MFNDKALHGVDLEVVFCLSFQTTLLEPHARSLGLLKTHVGMMRRPGYCHDLISG